jgi:hypothetical protein
MVRKETIDRLVNCYNHISREHKIWGYRDGVRDLCKSFSVSPIAITELINRGILTKVGGERGKHCILFPTRDKLDPIIARKIIEYYNSKKNNGETLRKPIKKTPINLYSDEELLNEIHFRGYKTYINKIIVVKQNS